MEVDQGISFETICRLCIKPSAEMRQICDAQFLDLLQNIAPVSIVEADGLPQQVCVTCIGELSRCYVFKTMVIKNDTVLRTILHNRAIAYLCDLAVSKADTQKPISDESHIDIKHHVEGDSVEELRVDVKCENVEDNCTENNLHQHVDIKEELMEETVHSEPAKNMEQSWTEDTTQFQMQNETIQDQSLPRVYACKECMQTFTQRNYLNTHMQWMHSIITVPCCPRCRESFSITAKLHRLLQKPRPTSKKPLRISCANCSTEFAGINALSNNISVPSYTCDICNKSFYTSEAMLAHKNWHPKETSSHRCYICGNFFVEKSALVMHMKLHNEGRG